LSRKNLEEQLNHTMREAAEAKVENRSLTAENERIRDENSRLSRELNDTKNQVSSLQAQFATAKDKLGEYTNRVDSMEKAERERQQLEVRRRDFEALQSSLSSIVTVKPTGNGFVAVLPDNFFVTNQTSLALRVKAKMDALAQTLAAHPDAVFIVEGHSDTRANAEEFAYGRAQAFADYVAALGVSRTNFKIESRGATMPVSTAKSLAAKAQNRRVQLVFVAPEPAKQ
jgi:outer membrane protein OmpA-like peptidoglycan-associated protein